MYCLSEFFRSKDGREYFWQWDTNQTLTVLRPELTEVHYASPDGTALVTKTYEKDGQLLSDVPNILLQQSGWLTVWFCDNDKTVRSQNITVAARQKPASYVYTETEVLTWESLDERITALEESTGGSKCGGTALILPSPNGTRWRITVDDAGNLVTAVET